MALPSKQKPILEGDLHPMAKIIPITEHFQHFLSELKESFWGDLYGETISGTGFPVGDVMSGGRGNGVATATAATNGIL